MLADGISWHYGKYRGLLDLYVDDGHALFRFGEWWITQFRHADAECGHLIQFDDHIDLRLADLYLRQEERARIEQSYGFGPQRAECQTARGR